MSRDDKFYCSCITGESIFPPNFRSCGITISNRCCLLVTTILLRMCCDNLPKSLNSDLSLRAIEHPLRSNFSRHFICRIVEIKALSVNSKLTHRKYFNRDREVNAVFNFQFFGSYSSSSPSSTSSQKLIDSNWR